MSKTNKKPAPREPKTKAEIPAVVTVRTPTKSVTAANSRELTKGNLPDSSNDGLISAGVFEYVRSSLSALQSLTKDQAKATTVDLKLAVTIARIIYLQVEAKPLLEQAEETLLWLRQQGASFPDIVSFVTSESRSVSWKNEALLLAEEKAKAEGKLFDAKVYEKTIHDKYEKKSKTKVVIDVKANS